METKDLKDLKVKLKSGEYDGVDIMQAWISIDELISARKKISDLKSTLEKLTSLGCDAPSELDGELMCFYCNACLSIGGYHDHDCHYIAAKQLLNDTA